jgi:hypothetical protein
MSIFPKRACARRLTETGCSRCGELGIIEGTAVSVRGGWRPIESLDASDHLRVFSGGHRQAAQIQCEEIWLDPFDCPAVVRPLLVPQGALGNDISLRLQQDMRVIFERETVEHVFETAHVSIRAGDLLGFRNIALEKVPPKKARIFRIFFDGVEAIEVAGGIWLLCSQTHETLNVLIDGTWDTCRIGGHPVRHLTADEAAVFLATQETPSNEALRHA